MAQGPVRTLPAHIRFALRTAWPAPPQPACQLAPLHPRSPNPAPHPAHLLSTHTSSSPLLPSSSLSAASLASLSLLACPRPAAAGAAPPAARPRPPPPLLLPPSLTLLPRARARRSLASRLASRRFRRSVTGCCSGSHRSTGGASGEAGRSRRCTTARPISSSGMSTSVQAGGRGDGGRQSVATRAERRAPRASGKVGRMLPCLQKRKNKYG